MDIVKKELLTSQWFPAIELLKKKQKPLQQILMNKIQSVKQKNFTFYLLFYKIPLHYW